MGWIFLALLAHGLNALVFVVDKGLLGKKDSTVGQPAWYAVYSGLVSAGAGLLLFFDYQSPTIFVAGWSLVAGFLWVLALWLFFKALKEGEASRIVPITGSSVPLWTLLLAFVFLGEQMTGLQFVSVGLLIVGGSLLSIPLQAQGRPSQRAVFFALCGGGAFAAHFGISKLVYGFGVSFVSSFAYIRLGVGVWASIMGVALWFISSINPKRAGRKALGWSGVILLFVGSKVVGMVALVLQNYAIKIGNLTIVNALQGTQYIFVLVLAALVSAWAPRFFREEMGRVVLSQKIVGIVCIMMGLIVIIL